MDLDHPDLKPNLWVNHGEIPNNGVDDDENGEGVGGDNKLDRSHIQGRCKFLIQRRPDRDNTSIAHLQHRTPPHSTSSGYVDDVYGYDFAGYCSKTDPTTGLCLQCAGQSMPYGDSSVNPEFAHGTHVAGLVGAVQNNQQGVTGTAPRVQLMVLRVRDV